MHIKHMNAVPGAYKAQSPRKYNPPDRHKSDTPSSAIA